MLILAVVAGACSQTPTEEDTARLTVVTSTTVLADFALNVVDDAVTVVSVVPFDTDPHVYEPTPADARLIANADVIIANGANLEPWFAALSRQARGTVVFVSEERAWPLQFEDDGDPDPHLWMVPVFAADYVTVIAETLAVYDPEHAAVYRQRAEAYRQTLFALDDELRDVFAVLPDDRRTLVTSHDAFGYFGRHYGFEVASLYGVSTETQPSARQVQTLIDLLRRESIPTIFVETTVNQLLLTRIAIDAQVAIGTPLYGDALGPPGSVADSYVAMMRHNVKAIIDGLSE
ncbi:MAG: zinc ABC transporter substrate-binding protein [Nitriliruptoraceae bacterium]